MSRIKLVVAAIALAQGCSGELISSQPFLVPRPSKWENACSFSIGPQLMRIILKGKDEQLDDSEAIAQNFVLR
jgi:hypothetical protein